jgi:hypothetical protein
VQNKLKIGKSRKKQNQSLDLTDPRLAQQMLEAVPTEILAAGINSSLEILQKRGIHILDWDQRERELYRIKAFGSRVYFLASILEREDSGEGETYETAR